MTDFEVITEDSDDVVDNLSCIYEVIETAEGRQSVIEQCQHGGISPDIARGVLVYLLNMCQEAPSDLVTALTFAANNKMASNN